MSEPYSSKSTYDTYSIDKELNWYEWEVNWPDLCRLLPKVPGKLLDFGIGAAEFTKELVKLGYVVDGCDKNVHMLNFGRKIVGINNIYKWDASTKCVDTYDIVFAKLSLHYVDDIHLVAKNIASALRINGSIIVSVPHPLRSSDNANKSPHTTYSYTAEIGTSGVNATMWHRPLEGWISPFISAGLSLIEISEPVPSKELSTTHSYTYPYPKRLNMKFNN